MNDIKKHLKEEFAKFFEEPSRESLIKLLNFETGEYDHLDFKKEWPEVSKLIRHVLAFSNSAGGCIIIGVEEKEDKTLNLVGLTKFMDKTEVDRQIRNYVPDKLIFEVLDFDFKDWEPAKIKDKKFQVISIEDKPDYIPLMPIKENDEIKREDIFIRKNKSSEKANYSDLQGIFNRRLETGYSSKSENDLVKNLAELRQLYNSISKFRSMFDLINPVALGQINNPKYPTEDYEDFVTKMIIQQKETIKKIVVKI